MPKSVRITTPWPTSGEVARIFRIPKRRQRELQAMAEEFFKQQGEMKEAAPGAEREVKRKNASAAD